MKVSVVILTCNNEDFIKNCLESVKHWAGEVVIVDSGSTDKTLTLAKKFGCQIYSETWHGFSRQRTLAASKAKNDWIFYLDADERMTKELKTEIDRLDPSPSAAGYRVKRENIIMGKLLKKGGWYPDWQTRLLRKSALKKWIGRIHEYPELKGEIKDLTQPIIHLTHRGINWSLEKTMVYTDYVADILARDGHFQCRWWHLLTAPAREFWDRGIKKGGLFEGMAGFVTVLYQTFDTFITYAKLWEKQRYGSFEKEYQRLDEEYLAKGRY